MSFHRKNQNMDDNNSHIISIDFKSSLKSNNSFLSNQSLSKKYHILLACPLNMSTLFHVFDVFSTISFIKYSFALSKSFFQLQINF
jgi:hypothetical protein